MRGDRFAISPALSMQGAGSPLPSCENPGTASEIVVVPARERLGKLDLPFILAIKKGAPLCLYGDIYCAAWYGNGVIVRILLATREYVVFNAEFENAGYHHAPFQVTFVAHAKLFHLPPFRRGQQLMDQFVHKLLRFFHYLIFSAYLITSYLGASLISLPNLHISYDVASCPHHPAYTHSA